MRSNARRNVNDQQANSVLESLVNNQRERRGRPVENTPTNQIRGVIR